jgi:hypothetical protein
MRFIRCDRLMASAFTLHKFHHNLFSTYLTPAISDYSRIKAEIRYSFLGVQNVAEAVPLRHLLSPVTNTGRNLPCVWFRQQPWRNHDLRLCDVQEAIRNKRISLPRRFALSMSNSAFSVRALRTGFVPVLIRNNGNNYIQQVAIITGSSNADFSRCISFLNPQKTLATALKEVH